MTIVAIATESDDFDAEVYRRLLCLLLGQEVQRWPTDLRFNGWKSVLNLLPAYLQRAAGDGVTRALVAIDNDGGAKRRPEHTADHLPANQARDRDDGCAHCLLLETIPASWRSETHRSCIVVPVQTLETWLLVVRGDPMEPSPERVYHRRMLKKRFFGDPFPSLQTRTVKAVEQIDRPHALTALRARPSFQRFEAELRAWTRPAV